MISANVSMFSSFTRWVNTLTLAASLVSELSILLDGSTAAILVWNQGKKYTIFTKEELQYVFFKTVCIPFRACINLQLIVKRGLQDGAEKTLLCWLINEFLRRSAVYTYGNTVASLHLSFQQVLLQISRLRATFLLLRCPADNFLAF